jgi:hypothetical protein
MKNIDIRMEVVYAVDEYPICDGVMRKVTSILPFAQFYRISRIMEIENVKINLQ